MRAMPIKLMMPEPKGQAAAGTGAMLYTGISYGNTGTRRIISVMPAQPIHIGRTYSGRGFPNSRMIQSLAS